MVSYYYPKGKERQRLINKAKQYIKNNPQASIKLIQYRISEQATKTKRKSISKDAIKSLTKQLEIDYGKPFYMVIGSINIYDYEIYDNIADRELRKIRRKHLKLSSAKRDYNELVKDYSFEISEYSGYENIEIRKAIVILAYVKWYGKRKSYKILNKSMW